MTILRRFLLLLLPGLLCAGFVRSASTDDAQYVFRSIDSSRGLSNNSVNAILQDRFGFMFRRKRKASAASHTGATGTHWSTMP